MHFHLLIMNMPILLQDFIHVCYSHARIGLHIKDDIKHNISYDTIPNNLKFQ